MTLKSEASPAFVKTLDADVVSYLLSHNDWKERRYPNAGGLLDQPAGWVEAMRILDSEYCKYVESVRKKV